MKNKKLLTKARNFIARGISYVSGGTAGTPFLKIIRGALVIGSGGVADIGWRKIRE